jgi:WD40 repeat protein
MDRGKRFRGFISYSQRDKAYARKLHRALESYRAPSGLEAALGKDRKLGRFFRDDEELGASESLGAALQGAIDDSENLIVICSPRSAASTWVDQEIRRFKQRAGGRVFAVVVDGVPNSGDPRTECFAPSLKVKVTPDGALTSEPDEPLAPDWRKDGFARLKARVAAGVLGVNFDDLWRRDRRRAAGQRALAAVAGVGVLAVAGLGGASILRAQNAEASAGLAAAALQQFDAGLHESALRLAVLAAREDGIAPPAPQANAALARIAQGMRPLSRAQAFEGEAFVAAVSADGASAVTGHEDGAVRVWRDGKLVRTLSGHTGVVTSVALSADGKRALSGGRDQTARYWDLETGGVLGVLQGHDADVAAVALSADGTRLMTGARTVRDGAVARVWDSRTSGLLAMLSGTQDGLNACAFSPNGTQAVVGYSSGAVRVFDIATQGQRMLATPPAADEGAATAVALSPDGSRVLAGYNGGVARLFDALSGAPLARLAGHESGIVRALFSADGARALTASQDGAARLWSAGSGAPLALLRGGEGALADAAFSADGARAQTLAMSGVTRGWLAGAGDGETILSVRAAGALASAAMSADGRRAVTGLREGAAELWDLEKGARIALLEGHRRTVWRALFSPDGKHILTGGGDSAARLWDAESGTLLHTLDANALVVRNIAFSPDGRIALADAGAGPQSVPTSLALWDVASGRLLRRLEGPEQIMTVAFSPDGALVAAGEEGSLDTSGVKPVWREDAIVRAWRSGDGQSAAEFKAASGSPQALAFSPDGALLLSAGGFGEPSATLWETASGARRGALTGHTDAVYAVAFAPDGRRALTGSADQTVRVWDIPSGQERMVLRGHAGAVEAVSFSRDGSRILSSSARITGSAGVTAPDGAARIWDGASGALLAVAGAHGGDLVAAQFDGAGRRIMTVSEDGALRVTDMAWVMGPEDRAAAGLAPLLAAVCTEKAPGKLSEADVVAAPRLRGREGQDVCAPAGPLARTLGAVARLLPRR